jgi:hypothetical protein
MALRLAAAAARAAAAVAWRVLAAAGAAVACVKTPGSRPTIDSGMLPLPLPLPTCILFALAGVRLLCRAASSFLPSTPPVSPAASPSPSSNPPSSCPSSSCWPSELLLLLVLLLPLVSLLLEATPVLRRLRGPPLPAWARPALRRPVAAWPPAAACPAAAASPPVPASIPPSCRVTACGGRRYSRMVECATWKGCNEEKQIVSLL